MLLCALYPDYGKQMCGSVLISYNNRPASDAIPLFKEAFVPAFAPLEPLTRNKVLIDARDQWVGLRRLGFAAAKRLAQASPLTQFVLSDDELDEALRDGEVLASLTDQIPDVLTQISRGASEFSPTPAEMRQLIGESYRQNKKPLVISFEIDGLDESDSLEAVLPSAVGSTRTRLAGTHLTPLAARRLLVPSALRPGSLLFDADGLVDEMDAYFAGALLELAASEGTATPEARGQAQPPAVVEAEADALPRGQTLSAQVAVEAQVGEVEAVEAQLGVETVEAQLGEVEAKSRLEDAARLTAAAKEAEARAIVMAFSGLVVPVSGTIREATRAEAAAASEAVRAAKREEDRAGRLLNIASVEGRIAEIEALAERNDVK